jgi:hypothetical protein
VILDLFSHRLPVFFWRLNDSLLIVFSIRVCSFSVNSLSRFLCNVHRKCAKVALITRACARTRQTKANVKDKEGEKDEKEENQDNSKRTAIEKGPETEPFGRSPFSAFKSLRTGRKRLVDFLWLRRPLFVRLDSAHGQTMEGEQTKSDGNRNQCDRTRSRRENGKRFRSSK